MFTQFTSKSWTPSNGSVVISSNTDYSISGTSKKIVWTSGKNQTAVLSFDSIDPSTFDELIFHIDQRPTLDEGNIFKITIDSVEYNFTRLSNGWQKVLFDVANMSPITTITIESLVDNLTLFFDYPGLRVSSSGTAIIDVIEALQNHISLEYNVSKVLSADVSAGSNTVLLTDFSYVYQGSQATLTEGATTEVIKFIDRKGTIDGTLSNSFTTLATVSINCPVVTEDNSGIVNNPVCGIALTDNLTLYDTYTEVSENRSKRKRYVNEIGLSVYIDCTSKKKTLTLSSQFQQLYGEQFTFLLDGERVQIYLDNEVFLDNEIGNNCRHSFFYRFKPMGYTVESDKLISTVNYSITSLMK